MDLSSAREWLHGRYFEDFEVGQRFDHHWGRTITESDAILFSTLTLAYNPLYLNRDHALAEGHPDLVVNPLLVFDVVFGLSVEDLSEKGGLFLGVEDLTYHRHVYPGETLTARSEVLTARLSDSRPEHGVVSWRTEGVDARGTIVIDFTRTNLVVRRPA
ncbi:MAG TPA: MaoC family dehydratase [Candidatus Dormibacteraeota bacterium]